MILIDLIEVGLGGFGNLSFIGVLSYDLLNDLLKVNPERLSRHPGVVPWAETNS